MSGHSSLTARTRMRLCLSWQAGARLRRSASSITAAARPTFTALHNKEYTSRPLNLSAGEVLRPGERTLQVSVSSEANTGVNLVLSY